MFNNTNWLWAKIGIVWSAIHIAGWSGITWESENISVKASLGQEKVIGDFHFKNSGNNPVTILSIRTSCDCTVAELEKKIYLPGEAGVLKAIFDVGDRMGNQEKHVMVATDDPEARSSIMLSMRVEIPELLTYSNRLLRWSAKADLTPQFIEVQALPENRITSVELKDILPDSAAVKIERIPEGNKFRIQIAPKSLLGVQNIAVTFLTRFEGGASHSFTIYALVR